MGTARATIDSFSPYRPPEDYAVIDIETHKAGGHGSPISEIAYRTHGGGETSEYHRRLFPMMSERVQGPDGKFRIVPQYVTSAGLLDDFAYRKDKSLEKLMSMVEADPEGTLKRLQTEGFINVGGQRYHDPIRVAGELESFIKDSASKGRTIVAANPTFDSSRLGRLVAAARGTDTQDLKALGEVFSPHSGKYGLFDYSTERSVTALDRIRGSTRPQDIAYAIDDILAAPRAGTLANLDVLNVFRAGIGGAQLAGFSPLTSDLRGGISMDFMEASITGRMASHTAMQDVMGEERLFKEYAGTARRFAIAGTREEGFIGGALRFIDETMLLFDEKRASNFLTAVRNYGLTSDQFKQLNLEKNLIKLHANLHTVISNKNNSLVQYATDGDGPLLDRAGRPIFEGDDFTVGRQDGRQALQTQDGRIGVSGYDDVSRNMWADAHYKARRLEQTIKSPTELNRAKQELFNETRDAFLKTYSEHPSNRGVDLNTLKEQFNQVSRRFVNEVASGTSMDDAHRALSNANFGARKDVTKSILGSPRASYAQEYLRRNARVLGTLGAAGAGVGLAAWAIRRANMNTVTDGNEIEALGHDGIAHYIRRGHGFGSGFRGIHDQQYKDTIDRSLRGNELGAAMRLTRLAEEEQLERPSAATIFGPTDLRLANPQNFRSSAINQSRAFYEVNVNNFRITMEDADTYKLERVKRLGPIAIDVGEDPIYVRAAGIDAPEISHGDGPVDPSDPQEMPFGRDATQRAQTMLDQSLRDGSFRLLIDTELGLHDRPLGLGFLGEQSFEEELVKQGLAVALLPGSQEDALVNQQHFIDSENIAVATRAGIFTQPAYRGYVNAFPDPKFRMGFNVMVNETQSPSNINMALLTGNINNPLFQGIGSENYLRALGYASDNYDLAIERVDRTTGDRARLRFQKESALAYHMTRADDNYHNHLEALRHGGMSETMRNRLTEFGSGWVGITTLAIRNASKPGISKSTAQLRLDSVKSSRLKGQTVIERPSAPPREQRSPPPQQIRNEPLTDQTYNKVSRKQLGIPEPDIQVGEIISAKMTNSYRHLMAEMTNITSSKSFHLAKYGAKGHRR